MDSQYILPTSLDSKQSKQLYTHFFIFSPGLFFPLQGLLVARLRRAERGEEIWRGTPQLPRPWDCVPRHPLSLRLACGGPKRGWKCVEGHSHSSNHGTASPGAPSLRLACSGPQGGGKCVEGHSHSSSPGTPSPGTSSLRLACSGPQGGRKCVERHSHSSSPGTPSPGTSSLRLACSGPQGGGKCGRGYLRAPRPWDCVPWLKRYIFFMDVNTL